MFVYHLFKSSHSHPLPTLDIADRFIRSISIECKQKEIFQWKKWFKGPFFAISCLPFLFPLWKRSKRNAGMIDHWVRERKCKRVQCHDGQ